MSKYEPPSTPKVIDSQIVFEEYITIKRDRLMLKDNREYNYYTLITHKSASVILATTPEGLFILNEEYRHPTKKILLGLPGGFLNENEDPLEGAKRELLEETGYSADHFELMGVAYPFPGFSGQSVHFVRARRAKKIAEPQHEISEAINTVLKTKREIEKDMRSEKFIDSHLCSALFYDSLTANP